MEEKTNDNSQLFATERGGNVDADAETDAVGGKKQQEKEAKKMDTTMGPKEVGPIWREN
jgi:hypothetical protein